MYVQHSNLLQFSNTYEIKRQIDEETLIQHLRDIKDTKDPLIHSFLFSQDQKNW